MKSPYYLLSLLILLVFGQCTIQKRHYNNGYHVEWKRRIPHDDHSNLSKDYSGSAAQEVLTNQPFELEDSESEAVVCPSESAALEIVNGSEAGLNEDLVSENAVRDTVPAKAPHRFEPVGMVASAALIGSFAVAFAPTPFIGVIPIAAFVLLGVAFLLSIISVIRYFWHKERYQSNLFGLVTFVICIGLLCLTVFVLLALLALM